MALTQGTTPERTRNPTLLRPEVYHPLHAMLRGRYQVRWKTRELVEHPGPLAQLLFVCSHRVIRERQPLLAALGSEDFDPRREVILESEPSIEPAARAHDSGPARAWVLDRSTDHVDIEVELDASDPPDAVCPPFFPARQQC